MPICNIILYMYIVHSSAMQAAAKTVINMTIVCHGQDCNSILLGPTTSGANELIVFRSHSVCNFQFKIDPTGKKLTWTCIPCYAVRSRLLKLEWKTQNTVKALNLLYSVNTGTQLLIAIIDARSIANAYYYGVSYAQQGLQRMRRSTSCALQR